MDETLKVASFCSIPVPSVNERNELHSWRWEKCSFSENVGIMEERRKMQMDRTNLKSAKKFFLFYITSNSTELGRVKWKIKKSTCSLFYSCIVFVHSQFILMKTDPVAPTTCIRCYFLRLSSYLMHIFKRLHFIKWLHVISHSCTLHSTKSTSKHSRFYNFRAINKAEIFSQLNLATDVFHFFCLVRYWISNKGGTHYPSRCSWNFYFLSSTGCFIF